MILMTLHQKCCTSDSLCNTNISDISEISGHTFPVNRGGFISSVYRIQGAPRCAEPIKAESCVLSLLYIPLDEKPSSTNYVQINLRQ